MKTLRNLTLIRTTASATLSLMGFALSSQNVFAQATYNYTGRPLVSLIPTTLSLQVSATLQLASWLAPNQRCIYVSSLPGFRLIISDGVDTFDSSLLPVSASVAVVSTDSQGQIAAPWLISLGNAGSSAGSDLAGQTCFTPPILDAYDWAYGDGFWAQGSPDHWSYPTASALTIMLTNEINLQLIGPGMSLSNKLTRIRNDITTNNGYACLDLVSFVGEVKAQTGKKTTAAQSKFILHTVTIMQSELSCGG